VVAADARLPYVDTNREPFIRCRTLGHSWMDYDSNWKPSLGTPITLRCERCGMERRDTVAQHSGDLITRHYTRPQGYLFTKAEEVPTRSQFRLMLLSLRNREKRRNGK
jgi:hypothetical protein